MMGIADYLIQQLKEISPKTMRSSALWKAVAAFYRSPLNRPSLKADKVSMSYFIEATRDAYISRKPVVWANLLVPSEIIHASGAIPFYPELASAVMAGAGISVRFLEASEENSFSRDLCSFHRAAIGAAIQDFLPRPHMMITCSRPCEGAVLSFSVLAELYGVPHYSIEVPENNALQENIEYLSRQIEEVTRIIALITGNSNLKDGIKQAIRLSNEARKNILEVEETRKEKSCPLDGWDAIGHIAVLASMPGTPACVKFYRLLAEELKEMKNILDSQNKDSLGSRILWMHLKPFYPNSLADSLRSLGAKIVCEEYNRCYWDELDTKEPFPSLAKKILSHPSAGPAKNRAREMVRLAKEYSVDGAVHWNHKGCRQASGSALLIKDELSKIGVRTLILDGECVDSREKTEGQIRTRLEAFLETLEIK